MSSETGARVSPIAIDVLPFDPPVAAVRPPLVELPAVVVTPPAVLVARAVVAVALPPLSPLQEAATSASPSATTPTDCFHLMRFLTRHWTGTGHGRRATCRR